jgi:hypothetical protein
MQELPERSTEIVRIRPTKEQLIMSEEYVKRAAQIACKKYLTEMDLVRIQKYSLMARMACNSTMDELKRRLEHLLGRKPPAPIEAGIADRTCWPRGLFAPPDHHAGRRPVDSTCTQWT